MRILLGPLLAGILFVPVRGWAQQPSTDVFVMEMTSEPEFSPEAAVNITNRRGYDNQPHFSRDGRFIYYVSIREDEQADVYRYDVASEVTARVTFSDESEFSPTTRAGGIDVVRVERDGTQRLWHFDLERRDFDIVAPDLAAVGYYGWIDDETFAAFIVGEPHVLVSYSLTSGTIDTLSMDVGRTIARVPGRRAVSFVRKDQASWSIDMYDLEKGSGGTITPTLPGREDFAWLPDGRIVMADGAALYVWTSGDGTWSRFADLADHGIREITRIAVSPTGNLLAFVAER